MSRIVVSALLLRKKEASFDLQVLEIPSASSLMGDTFHSSALTPASRLKLYVYSDYLRLTHRHPFFLNRITPILLFVYIIVKSFVHESFPGLTINKYTISIFPKIGISWGGVVNK